MHSQSCSKLNGIHLVVMLEYFGVQSVEIGLQYCTINCHCNVQCQTNGYFLQLVLCVNLQVFCSTT